MLGSNANKQANKQASEQGKKHYQLLAQLSA